MVNGFFNGFFNVTGFSHFTMVNPIVVCCVSNGGRMKAKFTILVVYYVYAMIKSNKNCYIP